MSRWHTRAFIQLILLAAASPAWCQFDGYPSTGGQYPSTGNQNVGRVSRPVQDYPSTNPRSQSQPYGPAYDRRVPQYDATSAPYPTSDSPGPYNDYRQQDELRQEYRPRPRLPRQSPPPRPEPELFEPTKLIAIVGDHYILAGDLLGDINQLLKPYEGKAPQEELDRQRGLLMQRLLPRTIQNKMLYQEMLATVPEEALPQIERKLNEEFDKSQLPSLIKRAKVNSAAELDAKLREYGTSIEKQRKQFAEQVLAREFIRTKVSSDPDVSHQLMLRYYNEHLADYEREARVRWEELSVRFAETPNKQEAYRKIAQMGNRVLRGAAFSRVAREDSQGFTASEGGWHDWTSQGALISTTIDEALFTLPLNELSQIIESDDGFHIIRVLDREPAGRSPFFKEQVRIKNKLQKEKRDKEVEKFIADLQARTRVWTIFDEG